MTCDHAPARASIVVFRESTMFVGFQELGMGQTALLGQCRRCKSTIAIEIDVARGGITYAGEIGGVDVAVGTVRAPSEMAMNGEQPCTRNKWCGDFEGHSGECIPPF